jgi:hypothetical protein
MITTTKKDLGQLIKIINKIIKDLEKQNKAKLRF